MAQSGPKIFSTLRPPLAAWAKRHGLRRLESSPPAYTKALGPHHLSLWVQQSSGGWDPMLGGTLTVNLQWAEQPRPGVHAVAGSDSVVTWRVPQLWDDATRARALALHNAVVARRGRPAPGVRHVLDGILSRDEIEARYHTPLEALPANDYWMPFMTPGDGAAWGELLADTLNGCIDAFLDALRSERDDVPQSWR